MKPVATDIDIDVPDRKLVLPLFKHTIASIHNNGDTRKHNTGVYFHDVPVDPFTGQCTIDHKDAEDMGYFKIDVLNVNLYQDVENQEHLERLLAVEPVWELLQNEDFCNLVFHMRGHHGVCQTMQPCCILELAAVLAMIRPSKRYLIGKSWDAVFAEVWKPPLDGSYYFKKAHSVSYAMAIKLHINLVTEQIQNGTFQYTNAV